MPEKSTKIELIKADEPTINGRVYPKEELEKAIAKLDDALVGRLGENTGTDPTKIDLGSIAFLVENVRMDEDSVVGDMKILPTPQGKILKESLPAFRYAPAGTGNVDDEGNISDYNFMCVDAVLNEHGDAPCINTGQFDAGICAECEAFLSWETENGKE